MNCKECKLKLHNQYAGGLMCLNVSCKQYGWQLDNEGLDAK